MALDRRRDRLQPRPQRRAVPAEIEAVLAWAVREGATNVVRHSDAHRCAIRVDRRPEAVAVEIEDDGVPAPGGEIGSGLAGLAERAARPCAAPSRPARCRRRLPAASERAARPSP